MLNHIKILLSVILVSRLVYERFRTFWSSVLNPFSSIWQPVNLSKVEFFMFSYYCENERKSKKKCFSLPPSVDFSSPSNPSRSLSITILQTPFLILCTQYWCLQKSKHNYWIGWFKIWYQVGDNEKVQEITSSV